MAPEAIKSWAQNKTFGRRSRSINLSLSARPSLTMNFTTPTLRTSQSAPASLAVYFSPLERRQMKRFPEPESPIVVKDAFPFEQLPAEIRNNVYRDLLIIKFPMMLVHDRPSFPDLDVPSFTLYPAILCTNKKIHNEAAAILYSENTFYVHVDTPVETFLDPYWQQANWSEMVLKPSIGLHAGFIKRVVMCSKDKGEIRDYMEIEARLLAIGIELCELLLWAIKFSDEETMEMNAMVNQGWLKKVEATELKKHHTWFPNTNELGDWTKGIWLMKREGAKSTAA